MISYVVARFSSTHALASLSSLSLLARYLRPQWPKASALTVLLLAGVAFQLLQPQILRSFIDVALSGGDGEGLLRLAALFAGVALLTQGLSVMAQYLAENVGWTATNALRADLAAHCLRLDQRFHKAHTPGVLIERIDGDVSALNSFFSELFVQLASSMLLLAGAVVLTYREDWRAGLAVTAFAICAYVAMERARTLSAPALRASREASATFYGFIGEVLGGREDIAANGGRAYVLGRFTQLLREWLPIRRREGITSGLLWTVTNGVITTGQVTALTAGAYLWGTGAITVGTVYLLFRYVDLLRQPIERIRHQLARLQQASVSLGRVQQLLTTAPGLPDHGADSIPTGAVSVTFDGVHFSYDRGEPVLHGLDLTLPPGSVLGVLGRTGSGKTTIGRLLLRFYDPDQGAIRLGGVDLRAAPLAQVRRRVGLVTQDVQMFHASVRDNITFYDPSIGDGQLLEVLDDLGLVPWLRTLPAGLDSLVGPGGVGLSAGQAQLLALVRVFLRDPGVIILDEASSRLDPATERLTERAVRRLVQGRTAIIIAHRLATLHHVDLILVLEQGRVVESGERTALAADPDSQYARLLQRGTGEVLA